MFFPEEDNFAHSQYFLFACSSLDKVCAVHTHIYIFIEEQQLIRKEAINLKRSKQSYYGTISGEERKEEMMQFYCNLKK